MVFPPAETISKPLWQTHLKEPSGSCPQIVPLLQTRPFLKHSVTSEKETIKPDLVIVLGDPEGGEDKMDL